MIKIIVTADEHINGKCQCMYWTIQKHRLELQPGSKRWSKCTACMYLNASSPQKVGYRIRTRSKGSPGSTHLRRRRAPSPPLQYETECLKPLKLNKEKTEKQSTDVQCKDALDSSQWRGSYPFLEADSPRFHRASCVCCRCGQTSQSRQFSTHPVPSMQLS